MTYVPAAGSFTCCWPFEIGRASCREGGSKTYSTAGPLGNSAVSAKVTVTISFACHCLVYSSVCGCQAFVPSVMAPQPTTEITGVFVLLHSSPRLYWPVEM